MTGPEDSQGTRPISVAELLARNGTIGAPPHGGRRRRRRGDTDSISVAELTGEIPIVTDRDITDEVVADEVEADEVEADEVVEEPETQPREAHADAEPIELNSPATSNGVVEHQESETESVDEPIATTPTTNESDDDYADAVSDYAAHIQQRETDVDVDFFAPPRRSSYAPPRFDALGGDAEEMSPDPDPVEDDTALDWSEADAEVNDDDDIDASDTVGDLEDDAKDSDSTRPYLRTTTGTLFGGQTVADDLARGGTSPGPADIETDDDRRNGPAESHVVVHARRVDRGAMCSGGRIRRRLVRRFRPAVEVEQHRRAGAVRLGDSRPGGRGAGGAQDRGHRQHADRGRCGSAGHVGPVGAAAVGLTATTAAE